VGILLSRLAELCFYGAINLVRIKNNAPLANSVKRDVS
jgi:hypothetical protein